MILMYVMHCPLALHHHHHDLYDCHTGSLKGCVGVLTVVGPGVFVEWPTQVMFVILDCTVVYELRLSMSWSFMSLPTLCTFESSSLEVLLFPRSIWLRVIPEEGDLGGISGREFFKHIVAVIDCKGFDSCCRNSIILLPGNIRKEIEIWVLIRSVWLYIGPLYLCGVSWGALGISWGLGSVAGN